tara:strand:+ start:188 stop:514 length:327 start_codon:yes stop_codon:yes gene_type:complete
MSNYGKSKKQICFESTAKLHADLKIRLHYDEIKIKNFFNEIVRGYIEKNENMMAFIHQIKEKKKVSQTHHKKIKKENKKEKQIINQFGLNENDVETIFDILEKEYESL